MPVKIVVKPTAGGNKIEKEVEPEATIFEVKEQLAEQANIPATEQRLIYKGQILKDERTVESYGGSSHSTKGLPWCCCLKDGTPTPNTTAADTLTHCVCPCRDRQ
jgi:ubiquilin